MIAYMCGSCPDCEAFINRNCWNEVDSQDGVPITAWICPKWKQIFLQEEHAEGWEGDDEDDS